jgi:hypothetical protein
MSQTAKHSYIYLIKRINKDANRIGSTTLTSIRLESYINLIKSRFIFDELGFNKDCNLTNSGMPD